MKPTFDHTDAIRSPMLERYPLYVVTPLVGEGYIVEQIQNRSMELVKHNPHEYYCGEN